jgi:hypothetical protein
MAEVENIIRIHNARLSFHSLFTHEIYEKEDTGKFSATLLIPKDTATHQAIEEGIDLAIAEKWGKKPPAKSKIKTTFRDGDNEVYDGYAGMMALKGTNTKRIHTITRQREPVVAEDDLFYNGCYVMATVTFNGGKDSYGNYRIWTNLRAVQFYKHGERFGGGTPVNIDDEFEQFDDEEEEVPEDMGV